MMLVKSLIYLCVTPLSTVLASYLGLTTALSSAVERAADHGFQYSHPRGQYPVERPDHHPHHPEKVNGTIYEFISNSPKFTLLTKALNFEEKIAALLNGSSAKLTFFAPPDEVLRRKRGHHPHLQWSAIDELWDGIAANPLSLMEYADLGGALDLMDNVDHPKTPGNPEKRKKIIKFILHVILSYHVIDAEYDIEKLGAHNTLPSHLKFPHLFDHQPIRLRFESILVPPMTWINLFSRILFGNISATNGFVHVVSQPLIPPPSVFQELYMVPEVFSILTSTLQRSNLTKLLDLRYVHNKGFEGSNLVTVFAPTNHAFEKLPKKLKLFLFSPFGEGILHKLLRYHIVPDMAFFSDYAHHREGKEGFDFVGFELSGDDEKTRRWFNLGWRLRRKSPVIEPISRDKYTLETALVGHTLDVLVDKKRVTLPLPGPHKPSTIKTKVIVNRQLALVRDVVGLNGAIHAIHKLLDPRKHHHQPPEHQDEQTWEDWEEWLPQWADAN